MALLTWNDSYSVKVALFDDQHKKLIGMINELHDAMKVGKGKDVMAPVLARLADYTRSHFAAEEQKMKEHGFTGYEEHKKEHNLLMVQVADLQQRLASGQAPITQEVMAFLKSWLTSHIQGMDQKYGEFFQSKGV